MSTDYAELIARLRAVKGTGQLMALFTEAADALARAEARMAALEREFADAEGALARAENREDAEWFALIARAEAAEKAVEDWQYKAEYAEGYIIPKLAKERDGLKGRAEAAEKALEPFAKVADYYEPDEGDDDIEAREFFKIGDLRCAREVLRRSQP